MLPYGDTTLSTGLRKREYYNLPSDVKGSLLNFEEESLARVIRVVVDAVAGIHR
jgi:hypothetical protein